MDHLTVQRCLHTLAFLDALQHTPHKCTIQPSTGGLCEAVCVSKAFEQWGIYCENNSESGL